MEKNGKIRFVVGAIGMLLLILDSKTALSGAGDGVTLCIRTVIPALFPFFVLSAVITPTLTGWKLSFPESLSRAVGVPSGAEGLLVTGGLGGYPVGAGCVADWVRRKCLTPEEGRRMMVFCNNAGPSFLFGIVAGAFPEKWMAWAIWSIQILSALAVGLYFSPGGGKTVSRKETAVPPLSESFLSALRAMASVCGWVILFRVMLAFFQQWFFWMLPENAVVAISGILELTNGCCALATVSHVGVRFTLCCGMLAFGGICVAMQTSSLCAGIPFDLYLPGKLLQSLIAMALALCLQPLFSDGIPGGAVVGVGICAVFFLIILCKKEKWSRFSVGLGV